MRSVCLPLLAAVTLTATVAAQVAPSSFTYPNFSSVAGIQLNGAAAQSGSELLLTPNTNNQAGTAWYTVQQPVLGGFDCQFTFRVTPSPGGQAADGFVFAIHDDPAGVSAIGVSGGALGYSSVSTLQRSLVVEFDSWPNGDFGELVGNQISVHTNGPGVNIAHEAFSIGSVAPPFTIADSQPHLCRITYLQGLLEIYVDNLVTPLLQIPYDLRLGGVYTTGLGVQGLGLTSGMAWVGFCGGTGGVSQAAAILDWTWASVGAPRYTLTFSQPQGNGSLRLALTDGPVFGDAYTVLSFAPANVSNPGGGWLAGLHITMDEVVNQIAPGLPPFVLGLDGSGGAVFNTNGLPPGLPSLHAVSLAFVGPFTLSAVSNVASITVL